MQKKNAVTVEVRENQSYGASSLVSTLTNTSITATRSRQTCNKYDFKIQKVFVYYHFSIREMLVTSCLDESTKVSTAVRIERNGLSLCTLHLVWNPSFTLHNAKRFFGPRLCIKHAGINNWSICVPEYAGWGTHHTRLRTTATNYDFRHWLGGGRTCIFSPK